MKKWMLKRSKTNIKKMSEALNISESLATLLAHRGVDSYKTAMEFLSPNIDMLDDAYQMKGMDNAIKRTRQAIESGERITVFGDYDVDGVSSTVIIFKTLKLLGANVSYHIPHRQKDGYGLNMNAVNDVYKMGTSLLITCDNGIASVEEIKKANELDIEVIVIDHHEPGIIFENNIKKEILPPAYTIVDPKQEDCGYKFKFLCAGGLAYKFSKLLTESFGLDYDKDRELLSFAAIATICDIVDLIGENRIIAYEGLKSISKTNNIGLNMLIKKTGLDDRTITEYHVGFVLGPNINATGRLESAKIAVELFTTNDESVADCLSDELINLNNERKNMTENAAKEIIELIENGEYKNQNVLVIYNKNIHESIAGIVAGRVKERYYKPTIVLTKGEGLVKGSARSIESYNIFEELSKVKNLFLKFGGHPMAAGLSMIEENVDELRKKLNENETLSDYDLTECIRIDKDLDFKEINIDFIKKVNSLAPFGKGNPIPIFGSKNIKLEGISILGKNQNVLKLMLRSKETNVGMSAISFEFVDVFIDSIKNLYGEEKYCKIIKGEKTIDVDILYTLTINEYNGRQYPQLMIKDFRIL